MVRSNSKAVDEQIASVKWILRSWLTKFCSAWMTDGFAQFGLPSYTRNIRTRLHGPSGIAVCLHNIPRLKPLLHSTTLPLIQSPDKEDRREDVKKL